MILNGNSPLDRFEWAAEKIKSIIGEQKEQPVALFDIGSRDNILKEYLLDSPIEYKGFDLDPITPITEKWNIELPFPYSYPPPGIVTLLEVIEHLNYPGLCLKNIGNLTLPGGYLILTTPNPKSSTSRLHLLSTGELSCFTQSDLDLNHHVFTPWIHMVEKILVDAGFIITEYVTLDGKTTIFDSSLFKGNILKRFTARLVKKVIEHRDPSACGMAYGIVAKKSI